MNNKWKVIEGLGSEEAIRDYLEEAKNIGDEDLYQQSVRNAGISRALLTLSRKKGVSYESLCKQMSETLKSDRSPGQFCRENYEDDPYFNKEVQADIRQAEAQFQAGKGIRFDPRKEKEQP